MIAEVRRGLFYVAFGSIGAIGGAILADKAGQDGRLGLVAGIAGGLLLAEAGLRRVMDQRLVA
jgi:hypothetical protein